MLKTGSYVCSTQGHDLGRIYIVVKVEGEFAYCVDGEYRLLSNPKKKRLKHLSDLHMNFDLQDKLLDNKLHDFEIKKKIKDIMHKD